MIKPALFKFRSPAECVSDDQDGLEAGMTVADAEKLILRTLEYCDHTGRRFTWYFNQNVAQ